MICVACNRKLKCWWKVWGCSCSGVISGIFTPEVKLKSVRLQGLDIQTPQILDSERLPRNSGFPLHPPNLSNILTSKQDVSVNINSSIYTHWVHLFPTLHPNWHSPRHKFTPIFQIQTSNVLDWEVDQTGKWISKNAPKKSKYGNPNWRTTLTIWDSEG